jgi:Uma2 family endonuclease
MADNTLQFRWIVTIKEGLEWVFRERPDVFVAGDLLWYPVEGRPEICIAPDAMVAFGRPKGDRGSYKQWEEGAIAPQVVFEILSPNNRVIEMERKLLFYDQYGVQEYYIYDPDYVELAGRRRVSDELRTIREMNGWRSPLLEIRFEISGGELKLYGPDDLPFLSFQELAQQRDQLAQQRDQLAQQRDQARIERDAERERSERLAAQLRAQGIEPSP